MDDRIRYQLLTKVEGWQDYAKKCKHWLNEIELNDDKFNEINNRIYKFDKILEHIREYASSKPNDEELQIDTTKLDELYAENGNACYDLTNAVNDPYYANVFSVVFDELINAEMDYVDNRNEEIYFSNLDKIVNTAKQYQEESEDLKYLTNKIISKYGDNIKPSNECLNLDKNKFLTDFSNKQSVEYVENVKYTMSHYNKFGEELKSISKNIEEDLLRIMDSAGQEFEDGFDKDDYERNALIKMEDLIEQLHSENINTKSNFEALEQEKRALINEMENLLEHCNQTKNNILEHDTVENLNTTKKQFKQLQKLASIDSENIPLYASIMNKHLDCLKLNAEQIHSVNQEEYLNNISTGKQHLNEYVEKINKENKL